MTIHITEEIIDRCRYEPLYPLSEALKAFPQPFTVAENDLIQLTPARVGIFIPLPEDLRDWNARWEYGKPMQPISFNLSAECFMQ